MKFQTAFSLIFLCFSFLFPPYLAARETENLFWQTQQGKKDYLSSVYKLYRKISQDMNARGYHVNFGVVADVACDIEDKSICLVEEQRIFSERTETVIELAGVIIDAMNAAGIIPVVKHFPGLGAGRQNSHYRLPLIDEPDKILLEKDILPFRKLIESGKHFWVMTSHAVYPALDSEPASLSYKIQTKLLRQQLNYNGIIIADELLHMQSLQEYAQKKGIKDNPEAEIVVRAFKAGTDIALIYPQHQEAEEKIASIIEAAKRAVKEGIIKEKDLNASVQRIIQEKERIFKRNLNAAVQNFTIEEKIAQKIMIDDFAGSVALVKKYKLCGIRAHDPSTLDCNQEYFTIPIFVAGQHEGGDVHEKNLNSPSAYTIGREFETHFLRNKLKPPAKTKKLQDYELDLNMGSFAESDEGHRQTIKTIADSIDEIIAALSLAKENNSPPESIKYLSPLNIKYSSPMQIKIKPFNDTPFIWVNRFPDKLRVAYAYKILKEAWENWQNDYQTNRSKQESKAVSYLDRVIPELELLKAKVRQLVPYQSPKALRVLCLACHPDDEDCEALLFLKNKFNAETFILLATRGEGGENQPSPALNKELAFLRTEEMENSALVLGVNKVYYLDKEDFGYCFDPQEAIKKWDKKDTLYRLVYFYRLIKPDIIITKHNINSNQHCQHRALAILSQEAFDLSGNARAYPQMFKEGLSVWQPCLFYQRKFRGEISCPWDDIVINVQDKIPASNGTYHDIAQEAISQHKTQGKLSVASSKVTYELVKAADSSNAVLEEKKENIKGKIIPSGIPGVKVVFGLKIGLVEQGDNIFYIALKTLGLDFKRIDARLVNDTDLTEFDTIVLAKGANDILAKASDAKKRIDEFVNNGGNLVVFAQDIKPSLFFAPSPVSMKFTPVSDENAPVSILIPNHALFNFPNRVSSSDFKGWVQNRGLYFSCTYSDKYDELLNIVTAKSKSKKGGYLIATYGKGSFILTTLSWYRQLKEFHLGAFKNLANMLAYPFAL